MLKPTSNFRLNKQAKRFMATIVDPVKRAEFKHTAIQAQLYSEVKPPKEKGRRQPQGNSTASE